MPDAGRDTATLSAGALSARFVRDGDRWGHEIILRDADCETVVLRSVEGSPDESWPASPPFTQLHIEERGCQPVFLLMGQAGDSIWSASVEAEPSQSRLVFDVAARVNRVPSHLGSVYLTDGVKAVGVHSRRAEWEVDSVRVQLKVDLADPTTQECQIDQRDKRIRVGPTANTAPATIRWAYSVSVSQSSLK